MQHTQLACYGIFVEKKVFRLGCWRLMPGRYAYTSRVGIVKTHWWMWLWTLGCNLAEPDVVLCVHCECSLQCCGIPYCQTNHNLFNCVYRNLDDLKESSDQRNTTQQKPFDFISIFFCVLFLLPSPSPLFRIQSRNFSLFLLLCLSSQNLRTENDLVGI